MLSAVSARSGPYCTSVSKCGAVVRKFEEGRRRTRCRENWLSSVTSLARLGRRTSDLKVRPHTNLNEAITAALRQDTSRTTTAKMAPKKKVERAAQENISLGPQVREGLSTTPAHQPWKQTPRSDILTEISHTGELVFGVARIFASFNDTFVHVTDLSYV